MVNRILISIIITAAVAGQGATYARSDIEREYFRDFMSLHRASHAAAGFFYLSHL